MKKTKRNVIAAVSATAMMGILSIGMVKVIDANNEANKVYASTQAADTEFAQARLDFKAKQLEVNTDQTVSKRLNLENVVKVNPRKDLQSDRLEKDALELESKRLEKNEDRFNDYLELNGVKTPEELASLGPDKFIVDEAEWAAAKVKWLERNPGYTEEDADNARGQYETDRWLEILEYYGIHPANNEKGWEYIKKDTLEDDILECLEEAPIEETSLEEF